MITINNHHLSCPTVITKLKLGTPIKTREKWAEEAYKLDYFSFKTNLQAQMSSYHIWTETKVYNDLLDLIQNTINNTEFNNNHIKNNVTYNISEAWSAIYREGNYANSHCHKFCQKSFVYYIKVGDNTSPLIFDHCNFGIEPQDDLLVMFDGHLEHSVPPHKGQDRIILAGNCLLGPSNISYKKHTPNLAKK